MILGKIILFIKIIFKSNFKNRLPDNIKLLIFDGESINGLQNILKDFEYFVLETRFHRIKTIYFNKRIFFSIFKNLKKGFYNAYLLSIIDEINPKVIFTFIDNSYKFSLFSKYRKNKYIFVALQNGARYEHKITNELIKKKIKSNSIKFNIPNFLCFGDYEVHDYKKNNQLVTNFLKVGSLKLSNYISFKKKNKIKIKKNFFDILLISDVNCWDKILDKLNLPIEKGVITIIKFCINFAIDNNLKLKIAVRNFKENYLSENNFYKKNLNKKEYNYLKKNIIYRSKNFKTYLAMEKSKVVVGTMSTMLRENLALGGKTLACNFTTTNIFNFPIKGICSLNELNYLKFEKRLKKVLKINNTKYRNLLAKDTFHVISNKKNLNTIDIIKLKLKNFLINND